MVSAAHQGGERRFSAFARPRGDAALGIDGPVVEVHERAINAGRGVRKLQAVRVLSHAEAAQLHYELGEALRAFDLAKQLARDVDSLPRAATDPYPFRDHGTLADVGFMADGEPC